MSDEAKTKMSFRRYNMGDRGPRYLPGKIADSEFLVIRVGGASYTVWPSRVDGALVIQVNGAPAVIRPLSRIVTVGPDE